MTIPPCPPKADKGEKKKAAIMEQWRGKSRKVKG